jgi:DNA-binding CsgD family transcriptional regulator/cbb3-type cytochrome oxidase subunit 3
MSIVFVLGVVFALSQGNQPDEEAMHMIALDKSQSERDVEKRQYMNLLMFQQTGWVFALIIVPLAVTYYQNRKIFKRHRLRKASKIQRQRFARDNTLFARLLDRFPDLTPNELSLCQMLSRGLSSKEIAAELNISSASVNTARYRLRKRLSVPPGEELVAFLHKI